MQHRFVVKAETHEGNILPLRYFQTLESAESHPVKMSLWKRVWVEEIAMPVPAEPSSLSFPWTSEWPHGSAFTYIRAADGRRIMSLLGTAEQRKRLAKLLEGLR